jgi:hypothetical protein
LKHFDLYLACREEDMVIKSNSSTPFVMQNPAGIYSNNITIIEHTILSPQALQAFLQGTLFNTLPLDVLSFLGLGAVLMRHSCQAV